jgi:hypothetical protein
VVGRTPLANGEPGNDKVADLLVKLPDGTFFIIDVTTTTAERYFAAALDGMTSNTPIRIYKKFQILSDPSVPIKSLKNIRLFIMRFLVCCGSYGFP